MNKKSLISKRSSTKQLKKQKIAALRDITNLLKNDASACSASRDLQAYEKPKMLNTFTSHRQKKSVPPDSSSQVNKENSCAQQTQKAEPEKLNEQEPAISEKSLNVLQKIEQMYHRLEGKLAESSQVEVSKTKSTKQINCSQSIIIGLEKVLKLAKKFGFSKKSENFQIYVEPNKIWTRIKVL